MKLYNILIIALAVLIGIGEIANVFGAFMGFSFQQCFVIFCVLIFVGFIIINTYTLILRFKQKNNSTPERQTENKIQLNRQENGKNKKAKSYLFIVFMAIVVLQLIIILFGEFHAYKGDLTVETVNTMLSTNTVYKINPLTGFNYELGMPSRLKLLCLPIIYAFICKITGLSTLVVVFKVIPVIMLILTYVSYAMLANTLFIGDKEKKIVFLICVAILIGMINYSMGIEGFNLIYAGYAGTTLRGVLLINTINYACNRRWLGVILMVMAEACISWTLYGLGMCLLAAVIMFLVSFFVERGNKKKM